MIIIMWNWNYRKAQRKSFNQLSRSTVFCLLTKNLILMRMLLMSWRRLPLHSKEKLSSLLYHQMKTVFMSTSRLLRTSCQHWLLRIWVLTVVSVISFIIYHLYFYSLFRTSKKYCCSCNVWTCTHTFNDWSIFLFLFILLLTPNPIHH